jgi:hypothetical protein
MKSYEHEFSPDEAMKLLDATNFNRPINQRQVDELAVEIKAGHWRVNGETIILCKGKVLDGQHRLWGAVEAGKSIRSMVVEVDDPSVFDTIDTGRSRNGADTVAVLRRGETPTSRIIQGVVAAAAKNIIACGDDGRFSNAVRPSNHQVVEFLKTHGDLMDDVTELSSWGRWPFNLSIAAAVHWITKKGFPKGKEEFWRRVQSGVGLVEGSPQIALRNKALTTPLPPDFRTFQTRFGNIIKAWNFYANNTEVKALRYSPGTESFPTIVAVPGQKVKPVWKKMGRLAQVSAGSNGRAARAN